LANFARYGYNCESTNDSRRGVEWSLTRAKTTDLPDGSFSQAHKPYSKNKETNKILY